ncbi:MAG: hypothetical protein ACOX6I_00690 [Syntrophomonadaceae bacterium]
MATKMAVLKMFGLTRTTNYLPIEQILEKYPDEAPELLKQLFEEGLIQTSEGEKYNPEKDIIEQLKPGPKITEAGYQLLFRSQFLL